MDSDQNSYNSSLSIKQTSTPSRLFLWWKAWRKKSRRKEKAPKDHNLVYALSPTKIPRRQQLKHVGKFLNKKEKFILYIAIAVLALSVVYLGFRFYQKHLVTSPKQGGTYIEGVVSWPQMINPLYASNRDVDSDLSHLIYSRLFTYDAKGKLVPDLVQNWRMEDGGKAYLIQLKPSLKWQSGDNLSVDDVIFTFNLIKNPDYRSPLRSSFNGVEVSKVDDNTIRFSLSEPYADFLEMLTFGIMPQGAWSSVSASAAPISELNLKPIGSGPYMFSALVKNKDGEIKEYQLERNPYYYGDKPYIEKIIFKFYPDYNQLVEALNDNVIDGASYVPDDMMSDLLAKRSLVVHHLRLPQINAIFFNSDNNKSLSDLKVRQALAYAIDRDNLLNNVLAGSATRADGPILDTSFAYNPDLHKYDLDASKASSLLDEAGYKLVDISADDLKSEDLDAEKKAVISYASSTQMDASGKWRVKKSGNDYSPLVITLSMPANGRTDVAQAIVDNWQAVGVRTVINQVAASDLNENMIVKHDFQAFLYGEAVGLDPDVFSFWHSSQINGRGLNLAGYNNSKVDKLLSDARQVAGDDNARQEKYKQFQEIVTGDLPAIFLYSPSYNYVQSKRLRGFDGTAINGPYGRFAGVSHWYLKTKKNFTW